MLERNQTMKTVVTWVLNIQPILIVGLVIWIVYQIHKQEKATRSLLEKHTVLLNLHIKENVTAQVSACLHLLLDQDDIFPSGYQGAVWRSLDGNWPHFSLYVQRSSETRSETEVVRVRIDIFDPEKGLAVFVASSLHHGAELTTLKSLSLWDIHGMQTLIQEKLKAIKS